MTAVQCVRALSKKAIVLKLRAILKRFENVFDNFHFVTNDQQKNTIGRRGVWA